MYTVVQHSWWCDEALGGGALGALGSHVIDGTYAWRGFIWYGGSTAAMHMHLIFTVFSGAPNLHSTLLSHGPARECGHGRCQNICKNDPEDGRIPAHNKRYAVRNGILIVLKNNGAFLRSVEWTFCLAHIGFFPLAEAHVFHACCYLTREQTITACSK